MDISNKLTAVRKYVYTIFNDDVTGHDFFHMKRVAYMARELAEKEGADPFICEVSGWVHDMGDHKLFLNREQSVNELNNFLLSIDCTTNEINMIQQAVKDVSYSKGRIPSSLEGKIVQDADRLDAIGAIGVARTFAYGAANGQLLWHNDEKSRQFTSVQHFYDKLLRLTDSMNTEAAKQMADQRHQFMESFLQQFLREWE